MDRRVGIKPTLLGTCLRGFERRIATPPTRVEGVVGYAEPPRNRGLNLMQGPGYDQESTPGLVAAGATVIVFTTGRGTTIGNANRPGYQTRLELSGVCADEQRSGFVSRRRNRRHGIDR